MYEQNKPERLNPLSYVVFACIFQSKENAGTAMLEFLNAVLEHVGEEPIVEILDMKSEYPLMGERATQKYSRLDVRVKAKSGRLFNVEVQLTKDDMNSRSLFYGGRLGHGEFASGTPYAKMPTVRVINIVDFYMLEGSSQVVEPVFMYYKNRPGETATDKFAIYHIQLPAFRKAHPTLESVAGNLFFAWLYMFDKGYKDENEMEVLSAMTEGLKNFALRYNIAIDDPDLIRLYRMEEDGRRDVISQIYTAAQEAARDAEKNQKLKDAKGFKEEGVDSSIIAKVTGLSPEAIEAL